VPARLQGKDISPILDDPQAKVHDTVFSVAGSSKGLMLRDDRWVFIQYGEDAKSGIELFDMQNDPKQLTNLASVTRPRFTCRKMEGQTHRQTRGCACE
jgi:iduronate 2-sulfatase